MLLNKEILIGIYGGGRVGPPKIKTWNELSSANRCVSWKQLVCPDGRYPVTWKQMKLIPFGIVTHIDNNRMVTFVSEEFIVLFGEDT